MNELISRLAVITVCVIVLAAAVIFIVAGKVRNEDVTAAGNAAVENAVPETDTSASETETAVPMASETAVSASDTVKSNETVLPEESGDSSETSKSRTIITSRIRKDYDNNSVYIDMENVLQLPELPVGCEITALTTMLRYCGFDADKTDLARNYLPQSWGNPRYEDGKTYKDSFFDYFIGDPFSRGYGCFSNAIEKAANAYISDHGGGFTVKNISGSHPDVLYEYLAAGTPVICWATDGMIEPEYYETWFDNVTGEQLDWYLNEHCFVLAGFNMSADTVTLNDPMKGIIDYNINKFETRYEQMYRQAIVIIPDSGDYRPAPHAPVTEPPETESSVTESADEEASVTENADEEASETVSESSTEQTSGGEFIEGEEEL